MQRVDKKNYIVIFIVSLIIMFLMVGCSSKTEYTNSIKYFDNNITKDRLLHAAKRVFFLAGKETFVIDSYRNDLNVTKSKAAYKFYTMDIENDHFHFNVDDNSTENTLKATVSIYRAYGINNDSIDYIDKNSKVYNLFWDRLEYFLGYKKEWNDCKFYDFEGFLCDPIDLENIDANSNHIFDLTNDSENNNSKELMKIKVPNTINKNSDLQNDKRKKVLNNIPRVNSSGTTTKQEKFGVLLDNIKTFDSYKIDNYENLDINSTMMNNIESNKKVIEKYKK